MKNVIAVIGSIVIVAACIYGIYKQIDNYNKKTNETAYIETNTNTTLF